jgi:hypothetical protein
MLQVNVDPRQIRGIRHASGSELLISATITADTRECMPLLAHGTLAWTSDDRHGLPIPAQSVDTGSVGLSVPVTMAQLASVEQRRSGKDPSLRLNLTLVAQVAAGKVGSFQSDREMLYELSRDQWLTVLGQCGFGQIRVVELPAPPSAHSAVWEKASAQLEVASQAFAGGQYVAAMGTIRTSLEFMLEALESALQIMTKTNSLGPRADAVEAQLRGLHPKRGNDPLVVLAGLVRATTDFCSGPIHGGLVDREDAQLALSTATALYAYLAQRPLQVVVPTKIAEGNS